MALTCGQCGGLGRLLRGLGETSAARRLDRSCVQVQSWSGPNHGRRMQPGEGLAEGEQDVHGGLVGGTLSLPRPLVGGPVPWILACRGDEVVLHALGRHLGHVPRACGQCLLDCQYLQHSWASVPMKAWRVSSSWQ